MSKRNCRFELCWHGSAYRVVDGENEVGFLIYFSGEWQARFVVPKSKTMKGGEE